MPDIFLSYSRDDQATARRFADGFERAGLSVWWDQALNPGEAFDKVTEKALDDAQAVVVLWSKKSVDSRWVRSEAMQANTSGKLVPVMIEPCKRPIMFELTHTVDLSGWNGDPGDKAWQSFLAGMRRFAGQGEPAQVPPTAAGASRRISAASITIALGLLLVVGAGLLVWSHRPAGVASESTALAPKGAPEVVPATRVPDEVSLAVLPFVNMSSDKEQEYFSDGLSEELLNQLAQIKGLRVTARTSSFAFKGKSEDLRVIGKALDVQNILEGSVRKDGNHLRITGTLVNSATGSYLWSQTFEREMTDIFAIQEDIARSVASALRITLGVGRPSGGGTDNVKAYDIYLRAVGLAGQGDARALQLFRESVALDPAFTDAWLALYIGLFSAIPSDPAGEVAMRKEQEEIRARLEVLAPESPAMRNVRMNLFFQQHKWAEAETEARAIMAGQSTPDAATEVKSYAIVLALTGRSSEAVGLFKRWQRMDPLSGEASSWLQSVLDRAGRPAEAQAEYERSRDLGINRAGTNWSALLRLWTNPGTPPAMIDTQFRLYLQSEQQPMGLDGLLVDMLGDRPAARAAIRRAFNEPMNRNIARLRRIVNYADHFGDRDLALAAMRLQFIDLHSEFYLYLWDPFETDLRADPRFKQILRELGLAHFFRTSGKWPDNCKPVGKDDFECR